MAISKYKIMHEITIFILRIPYHRCITKPLIVIVTHALGSKIDYKIEIWSKIDYKIEIW